MVDTFGQSSPLVAFRDSRPPSSASGSRRHNNGGIKSASPPQMYAPSAAEAPMATEEYTGTTTVNSSPKKVPISGRSNGTQSVANGARNSNSHAANLLMRKKGLPWLFASVVVVIFVLLILCGFLLYILYEHHGFYAQLDNPEKERQNLRKMPNSPTDHRRLWPGPKQNSMEGHFRRAAVVSENGMCSEIGRKVLLQGGNAVDAAIAVTACIGALNSHSAGLGGGFLMTYYHRFYGKCATVDAREIAPSRTNKDIFKDAPDDAQYGYKSVAVPGELHGYWTAFKRFGSGKIAWMDLLMPTANLLNEGFPVSNLMALNLEKQREWIINGTHSGLRSQFVNPTTGDLYREGEVMRDAVLSGTYKRLALSHDPIQLFYSANGEFARLIADEFANNGGFITRKDLHTYRSVVDDQPLLATSDAVPKLVFCGGKPSSAFAIAQLIVTLMLKFYPPGSNSTIPWGSDEYYHRLIEAQKHAYAMRTKLADTKFGKSFEEFALNMTRAEFVDEIVDKMNKMGVSKFADFNVSDEFVRENYGTSQITVVDADGNAVSMTSSINRPRPNESNFFGYVPVKANLIEPGKRPMSSMSPMIVYHKDNKRIKIAIGASGGSLIPSAISQVLTRVLAFNNSLKESIDSPRLHNQFTPFRSNYEHGFPSFLVQSLIARGHQNVSILEQFSANVQAIMLDPVENGGLIASNDFRRKVHSYPVGY